MNIDEVTKLILVLAVAFAIVILAWGLFRVLNSLANSVEDFRKAIKNISFLSDLFVEDYENARKEIYSIARGLGDFKSSFIDPVRNIGKVASVVTPFLSKGRKSTEKTE